MSILDGVQKIFEEKDVYYFRGRNTEDNLLYVPYQGIEDKNNHVDIYLEIFEDLKVIRFTFIEKISHRRDEVESVLLNLNADLNFGSLSLRSETDLVEYRIDYQLGEDAFSYEQYKKFIICCISIYEKLKSEYII